MWKKRKKLYDIYYQELRNYLIKFKIIINMILNMDTTLFLFVFNTKNFKQKKIRDIF